MKNSKRTNNKHLIKKNSNTAFSYKTIKLLKTVALLMFVLVVFYLMHINTTQYSISNQNKKKLQNTGLPYLVSANNNQQNINILFLKQSIPNIQSVQNNTKNKTIQSQKLQNLFYIISKNPISKQDVKIKTKGKANITNTVLKPIQKNVYLLANNFSLTNNYFPKLMEIQLKDLQLFVPFIKPASYAQIQKCSTNTPLTTLDFMPGINRYLVKATTFNTTKIQKFIPYSFMQCDNSYFIKDINTDVDINQELKSWKKLNEYNNTTLYQNQNWLIIKIDSNKSLYQDFSKLQVEIRDQNTQNNNLLQYTYFNKTQNALLLFLDINEISDIYNTSKFTIHINTDSLQTSTNGFDTNITSYKTIHLFGITLTRTQAWFLAGLIFLFIMNLIGILVEPPQTQKNTRPTKKNKKTRK